MHNCYSNRAYMHGYCSSCIYYFTFCFSLLTLLSHFQLLLSPLSLLSPVPQSTLTDTISTKTRRDDILRAFTSAGGKDSVYFTQKTYFFYFTLSLLQNTHISLSILQDISIKYSFFINFLLFSIMVILF